MIEKSKMNQALNPPGRPPEYQQLVYTYPHGPAVLELCEWCREGLVSRLPGSERAQDTHCRKCGAGNQPTIRYIREELLLSIVLDRTSNVHLVEEIRQDLQKTRKVLEVFPPPSHTHCRICGMEHLLGDKTSTWDVTPDGIRCPRCRQISLRPTV